MKGLEDLNHYEVNGKAIRVMPSQRDPSNRKSGVGNIFIKVFKKQSCPAHVYHTTFNARLARCKLVTVAQ